jgi:two-component system response regulator YesN
MTNVSPAYFSSVFKKEIGSSFVQYLTNARLARAKELLVKTENKTYEIATAVGFTEPNYFSFCFKRYEGISPSQYRHQNKDEKH